MQFMVDTNAKPIAHHTPVPVPLHWQEEVKAVLDQNVRLGVIKPEPIGETVTWCHRIVEFAKKIKHLAERLTFKHSMHMPYGKHATHSRQFTKLVLCNTRLRNLYLLTGRP